jgi:hypothetical protein
VLAALAALAALMLADPLFEVAESLLPFALAALSLPLSMSWLP